MLYETLGPTLPEGLKGAAALWGLAQKAMMTYPDAVRRAGHADGDALFDLFTRTRAVRRSIIEQGQDDERPDFGRSDH